MAGGAFGSLDGAQPLGVHLEGPFLSPVKPGVHEPRHLVLPTPERVGILLDTLTADETAALLTMVTLAPELEGGLEAVRRFAEAGVRVSLGHTDAYAAQVVAAADAGATLVTHIFNAQRPLNHREPGVPGAALYDTRFTCGLIADLHHVAPEICNLIWRAAAGKVFTYRFDRGTHVIVWTPLVTLAPGTYPVTVSAISYVGRRSTVQLAPTVVAFDTSPPPNSRPSSRGRRSRGRPTIRARRHCTSSSSSSIRLQIAKDDWVVAELLRSRNRVSPVLTL